MATSEKSPKMASRAPPCLPRLCCRSTMNHPRSSQSRRTTSTCYMPVTVMVNIRPILHLPKPCRCLAIPRAICYRYCALVTTYMPRQTRDTPVSKASRLWVTSKHSITMRCQARSHRHSDHPVTDCRMANPDHSHQLGPSGLDRRNSATLLPTPLHLRHTCLRRPL